MPAALTVKTAISYTLRYFEGLGSDDLANVRNRFQLLVLLQGLMAEIENKRNLKWLYTEDTSLVISSGSSSVATPSNFKDVGEEGSLWIPALFRELKGPRQQQEIREERFRDGDAPKDPWIYGLWDKKIQTVKVNADTALHFFYVRVPQTLSDSTDITDGGADDSTVLNIPSHYGYNVVLPGLLSRSNGVKAELRDVQGAIYKENLADMYKRERAGRGGVELFPEQEGVAY